jgi:tRNA-binding EMAP/Myf-like protein
MRGIMSNGMLLCACEIVDNLTDSTQGETVQPRVELLEPIINEGVTAGDRVTVEGFPESTPDLELIPKKKKWESCMPHMRSRDGNVTPIACYKNKLLYTGDANTPMWFMPRTLKNYTIS